MFIASKTISKPTAPKAVALIKMQVGRPIDPGRSLPILVAEQKGIFAKNGLDAKSTVFNRGIDTALIAGQLDIINDAPVIFLAAAVKGADLKLVAITLQADPYYVVSSKAPANIRTVAVNRLGGQDYYQLINSLRFLEVDISRIQFVTSLEDSAKYSMLLNKNVDAAGYQPTVSYFKIMNTLEANGLKLILNRTDNPNARYPTGIVTRGDYIKKNPQAVKEFILSVKEAITYARANKAESVKILMKEYQLPTDQATIIYNNFLAGSKDSDMMPNAADLKALLGDMALQDKQANSYNPANFIDTSYLPK